MQKSILCVDDNADHCELLKIFFEQQDYNFQSCETAEECLEMAVSGNFSALVLDNILRFDNGADIFADIKNAYPEAPLVFFTADARAVSREKALNLGADAYLVKPNDLENVVTTVSRLLSLPA